MPVACRTGRLQGQPQPPRAVSKSHRFFGVASPGIDASRNAIRRLDTVTPPLPSRSKAHVSRADSGSLPGASTRIPIGAGDLADRMSVRVVLRLAPVFASPRAVATSAGWLAAHCQGRLRAACHVFQVRTSVNSRKGLSRRPMPHPRAALVASLDNQAVSRARFLESQSRRYARRRNSRNARVSSLSRAARTSTARPRLRPRVLARDGLRQILWLSLDLGDPSPTVVRRYMPDTQLPDPAGRPASPRAGCRISPWRYAPTFALRCYGLSPRTLARDHVRVIQSPVRALQVLVQRPQLRSPRAKPRLFSCRLITFSRYGSITRYV